jgi:hypothetical protein
MRLSSCCFPGAHCWPLRCGCIDAIGLRAIAGKAQTGTPEEARGGYWMSHGLDLELRGDFQAAGIVFDRASSL